jgi:hypothetical protein
MVILAWRAEWEGCLKFKGSIDVGRERSSQSIDLCLSFRHGPSRYALLEDAHVSYEILFGIVVEFRFRRRDSNLKPPISCVADLLKSY